MSNPSQARIYNPVHTERDVTLPVLHPLSELHREPQDTIVPVPYTPRKVFLPYHRRRERFALIVAHRRCGKTVAEINEGIRIATSITRPFPPPQVAFISPTYAMGKRNAWMYAKHYTANIPGMKISEAELTLTFPNNGKYIFVGADNYDALRGMYLDHASLDEFGLFNTEAWGGIIRPALSDYNGSATFIGSAYGRNHFYDMLQKHKDDPDWLKMILRASDTGILSKEELIAARLSLTQAQYEQEYECSFDAAVMGTFYSEEISQAEADKHITSVSYDRAADVYAAFDLGMAGATSIWVYQTIGNEIHFLHHYESDGQPLPHYVDYLKTLPFKIDTLYLPHDAEARELQTGLSRKEFFEGKGYSCQILPKANVESGISAVRIAFSRMWFNRQTCEKGIDCLRMYRRQWDDKKKAYSDNDVKDWASHAADAMRYAVQSTGYLGHKSDWSKPISRSYSGVV